MRWTALFGDLEARAAALAESARSAEVADRARAEATEIGLADRLRAARGTVLLRLRDGSSMRGSIRHVGPDWVLVAEASGDEVLVPAGGLCAAVVGSRTAASPDNAVGARLGVRTALRRLAQDRSAVRISLVDGTAVLGTIDRVGADFLEVAVHVADAARRRNEVSESAMIAIAAVSAIRRRS